VVALIDDDPVAEVTVQRAARPPNKITLSLPGGQRWALRGGSGERVVAEAQALDALGQPLAGLLFEATVDGEPAVVKDLGPIASIAAGPPGRAAVERVIVASIVERRPPCVADHLRVVARPRAEARAVDATGLACPQAAISLDGERTYGSVSLALASGGNIARRRVQVGEGPVREIVAVRDGEGAVPLAIDVDAEVVPEVSAELRAPVAAAPLEVEARIVAGGAIELQAVDALGAASVEREIKVWPADGCGSLEVRADGRWLCRDPKTSALVFTDSVSGASVLVPVATERSAP